MLTINMLQFLKKMNQKTTTQNVIRNKFQKAYANRLEHEQDVEQSMKSHTVSPLPTPASPITTTSVTTTIPATTTSSDAKTNNEMQFDPNQLCDKLRVLMNSPVADSLHQKREISFIIKKLRELEIIV